MAFAQGPAPLSERVPPSDRDEPMDEAEFLQRCSRYGLRCFLAGSTYLFLLSPTSRRGRGGAVEITPEQAARLIYHDLTYNGEPVKLPYASLSRPDRISFRYTDAGRELTAGHHRRKWPKRGRGKRTRSPGS